MINLAALFDEELPPVQTVAAEEAKPFLSIVRSEGEEEETDDELDADLETIGAERKTTIKTPLFDIHFKTATVNDIEVHSEEGSAPLIMLDTIADKEIVRIALRTIEIQLALFGRQAIVDDTAPKASAGFHMKTGKLKEEFARTRTIEQIKKLETTFAEALASLATVVALSKERDEMFPFSRESIQLAYVTAASSETGKPYTIRHDTAKSIEDAIEYRRRNTTTFRSARSILEKQKSGPTEKEIASNKSAFELLGL